MYNFNNIQSFHFTAEIEKDSESCLYIGIVPNLPGAHSQAKSLDELNKNLQEVVALCLEEMTEEEINNLPEFIGFQQLSVAL